jgi:hypothetical protein
MEVEVFQMTITLPLAPQEEMKLRALAEARGLAPEVIVREALDHVLALEGESPDAQPESRPIWQVITENMKDIPSEVMAAMPVDGASQHDHYIYGWPKRDV